jgi:hypothetical protein
MERLKIIKELNNVANILEENGRISEASQITNVLIKIAQQTGSGNGSTVQPTQPTQGQPVQTPQLTAEQIKQNIKTRFNELIRLRSFAENYKKAAPGHDFPKYTIDESGYKFKASGFDYVASTLEELAAKILKYTDLKIAIPGIDSSKNEYADKIAQNIASAANWPDPEGGPEITKAINEKYMLGYNLLGGTYYIGNKQNPSDVIDKKDINDLKTLFLSLGKYYKDNKAFPESIYEYNTGKKVDQDINVIILEALKKDSGAKWAYINDNFKNHPNFDDIKRGFVQEYNRRDPIIKISLDNPKTLNEA